MRKFCLIGVMLSVCLGTACGSLPPRQESVPDEQESEPISSAEAIAFLNEVVIDTLARRFNEVCENAASVKMCKSELSIIEHLAPSEPPVIQCVYSAPVAVRVHDDTGAVQQNDAWLGKVVRVKGEDRIGKEFTTDVFVYKDDGRIVAVNILWWSGMGYSTQWPPETGPRPTKEMVSECRPS